MKRIIKSARNITRHYADKPSEKLASKIGISRWSGSASLIPINEGKWNYKITDSYHRLDTSSEYYENLKSIGAKYITVRYGDIYFYYDMAGLTDEYNTKKAQFDKEYYDQLDAYDVSQYKPTDAIIKKLMDYRAKGSMVNVKAIKDVDKLLTYYYGAKIIGWEELAYAIANNASISLFDYSDEIDSINRQAKIDAELGDKRSDLEIELGLGDSKGLITMEGKHCWLPKSILQFFIDNNIPVHIGKRTSGGRYDRNGAQWTEIEHLTLYPDSEDPINYDIAVHTNERADGSIPNTYTGNGTDERVSAKKIIEDLSQYVRKSDVNSATDIEADSDVWSMDVDDYDSAWAEIEKALVEFGTTLDDIYDYLETLVDVGRIDDDTYRQLAEASEEWMDNFKKSAKSVNASYDVTHLFKVGQKVRCNMSDDGTVRMYVGTVKETYPDHIIVDIPSISDHCWFEKGLNLDKVYPDYNLG